MKYIDYYTRQVVGVVAKKDLSAWLAQTGYMLHHRTPRGYVVIK